jgi:cell division protein FtsL
MNAAAKAIDNVSVFRGNLANLKLDSDMLKLGILIIAILVSSIAIIVNKNEQRAYFSELQIAQQQENRAMLEWGQLLLERTSLVTPNRVQRVAAKKLNMGFPVQKKALILRY